MKPRQPETHPGANSGRNCLTAAFLADEVVDRYLSLFYPERDFF